MTTPQVVWFFLIVEKEEIRTVFDNCGKVRNWYDPDDHYEKKAFRMPDFPFNIVKDEILPELGISFSNLVWRIQKYENSLVTFGMKHLVQIWLNRKRDYVYDSQWKSLIHILRLPGGSSKIYVYC